MEETVVRTVAHSFLNVGLKSQLQEQVMGMTWLAPWVSIWLFKFCLKGLFPFSWTGVLGLQHSSWRKMFFPNPGLNGWECPRMPLRNRNVLSLQKSEPRNIWKMIVNLLTTTDGDKYSNNLAVTYFLNDLLTKIERSIRKEIQ